MPGPVFALPLWNPQSTVDCRNVPGSVRLRSRETRMSTSNAAPDVRTALLVAYCVVGGSFAGWLAYSLTQQPLFPFQMENHVWTQWWLLTTCGDFWVLAFGFSTIVWFSEDNKLVAVLWILAVNLLGSSMGLLYLWLRVFRFGVGGLRMAGQEGDENSLLLGRQQ